MIAAKVIIPEEDGTIDEKKKVAGRGYFVLRGQIQGDGSGGRG
ncbi:MAG: hypothetical protein ACLTBV_31560 [Enterocloster bolteae]